MANKPKFKRKSNAQKYAIRAYYAKKNKIQKEQERKRLQEEEERRERYFKVMAEDFPKDFISDDEWDYIEAMASGPKT